jgi:hypothetical protein
MNEYIFYWLQFNGFKKLMDDDFVPLSAKHNKKIPGIFGN